MEIFLLWILMTLLVVWWATSWERSVGWALVGSLLLSPLIWAVVLLILGRGEAAASAGDATGRARVPQRSTAAPSGPGPHVHCTTCGHRFTPSGGERRRGAATCPGCENAVRFPPSAPAAPEPPAAASVAPSPPAPTIPDGDFTRRLAPLNAGADADFAVNVVGMRHAGQAAERAVKAAMAGTASPALVRDPKNEHDPNAVAVHLDHGSGPNDRFGWIPTDEVIDIAEVLDSGGRVTGMSSVVPMSGRVLRDLAYAASVRDGGTGSTKVRAGRCTR
ncbi:MAG: HIRAN domain-containing protein [Paracoccaceae bacterium]